MTPMSLSLSFLYLSLWHTPLVPLLLHLGLLPHIPLPAFGSIFPCIPLTAFDLPTPPMHTTSCPAWPGPNKLLDSQLEGLQSDNSSHFQLRPSGCVSLARPGPPPPQEPLLMLRWQNHLSQIWVHPLLAMQCPRPWLVKLIGWPTRWELWVATMQTM